MKQSIITLVLALTAFLLTTSCGKELFDKEIYDGVVSYNFMLDNVDKQHDWCLIKSDTVIVKTPDNSIYSVQLLTENPYASTTSEILAEGITFVWDGSLAELPYTVPVTESVVWVAALDSKGNYLGVTYFPYGTKEVTVTTSQLQQSGTLTPPTYQQFTYLYESTYPKPDDFDYNDMVLQIGKYIPNLSNSTVVDLVVTLRAAGTSESYAAAIQLAGIRYDDIASVEIVAGEQMDKDYPFMRRAITSEKLLVKGRKGEAVINLFENVHWVFGKQLDELGSIKTMIYNTEKVTVEDQSAAVLPITTVYRIHFKERSVARSLTFDRIDPFLLHSYNGGFWEVHSYAHKFDETLQSLGVDQSVYDNHISWSLVIPQANFRYPVEGIALCNYNDETGELFGPYSGFAQWMQNRMASLDWYNTLNRPQLAY